MNERTIKLTMTDETPLANVPATHRGKSSRQTFLITLNENGAEIRFSHAAIASRDSMIETSVGFEPEPIAITIHVEEVP